MKFVNIQKDLRINMHSQTVGSADAPLGEAFDGYIKQFGADNICFICSLVYNLGKMYGKREERARRKGERQYEKGRV